MRLALTSKYGAKRTVCRSEHEHASKREAARCDELNLLWRGGLISGLEQQPKYELTVGDVKIATYIGDFRYREFIGRGKLSDIIVEDCKGMKTPVYRLKKKLMLACFGIEIRET